MEATMIIFRTKWGSFLLLKKGYLRKKFCFANQVIKLKKMFCKIYGKSSQKRFRITYIIIDLDYHNELRKSLMANVKNCCYKSYRKNKKRIASLEIEQIVNYWKVQQITPLGKQKIIYMVSYKNETDSFYSIAVLHIWFVFVQC